MSEQDPLDNEIIISGKLSESGIEGKVKSRLISSIDRLGGNLVDLLNVRMENKTKIARAKTLSEVQMIEMTQKAVGSYVSDNGEFARRAAANYLSKIEREQFNNDAVLHVAVEDILALPDFRTNNPEADASPSEVDEDWLNFFENYAAKASTERMQLLWGKILSGEIRSPKTFSLTTLRVASELDQKTAILFQSIADSRLDSFSIPNETIESHPRLRNLLTLESVGLVQQPSGTISVSGKLLEKGAYSMRLDDKFVLKLTLKYDQLTNFRIPIVGLTTAGSQLALILPSNFESRANAIIAQLRPILGVKRAAIHQVIAIEGERVHFSTAEQEIFSES